LPAAVEIAGVASHSSTGDDTRRCADEGTDRIVCLGWSCGHACGKQAEAGCQAQGFECTKPFHHVKSLSFEAGRQKRIRAAAGKTALCIGSKPFLPVNSGDLMAGRIRGRNLSSKDCVAALRRFLCERPLI